VVHSTVRLESRFALIKGVGSLEVMSTSIYTNLNQFNFIRKHFLLVRCFLCTQLLPFLIH